MYEGQVDSGRTRSGISPRLILVLVLVALAVVFILQNSESEGVDFLWLDFRMPEWVIYLIMIAIGILIDRLVQLRSSRRRRLPPPPPPD